MLSILIPVYNYEVTTLVTALHQQGKKLGSTIEIIVFDDGSKSVANEKNEQLNTLENVHFKVLEKNVGLSQNRNLLAKAANFENLLFIDGDSLIQKEFLKKYCDAIENTSNVIYGGRVHPKNYKDKSSLRWKYGTFVEDKTAKERKKHPYLSTLFNNTLIKKDIFERVGFEKTITTYGHEDTLFSYALKQMHARIQHIDNPVIHGDIDPNAVFVRKTKSGLDNLKYLSKNKMIDPKYVKLLRMHTRLKTFGLDKILGGIYSISKKPIQHNLISKKPSLLVFNIFRITYFCHTNS